MGYLEEVVHVPLLFCSTSWAHDVLPDHRQSNEHSQPRAKLSTTLNLSKALLLIIDYLSHFATEKENGLNENVF